MEPQERKGEYMKNKILLFFLLLGFSIEALSFEVKEISKGDVLVLDIKNTDTKASIILPSYLTTDAVVIEDSCGLKVLKESESCSISFLNHKGKYLKLYSYDEGVQKEFYSKGVISSIEQVEQGKVEVFSRKDSFAVGAKTSWTLDLEGKECGYKVISNASVFVELKTKENPCLLDLTVTPLMEGSFEVLLKNNIDTVKLVFRAEHKTYRDLVLLNKIRAVEGETFSMEVFADILQTNLLKVHPSLVFVDGAVRTDKGWKTSSADLKIKVGSLEKHIKIERTKGAWVFEDSLEVTSGQVVVLKNSSRQVWGFDKVSIKKGGVLVLENDADPSFYFVAKTLDNEGEIRFKNYFEEKMIQNLLDLTGKRSYQVKEEGLVNLLIKDPGLLGNIKGGSVWTLERTVGDGFSYVPETTTFEPLMVESGAKEQERSYFLWVILGIIGVFMVYRGLFWVLLRRKASTENL